MARSLRAGRAARPLVATVARNRQAAQAVIAATLEARPLAGVVVTPAPLALSVRCAMCCVGSSPSSRATLPPLRNARTLAPQSSRAPLSLPSSRVYRRFRLLAIPRFRDLYTESVRSISSTKVLANSFFRPNPAKSTRKWHVSVATRSVLLPAAPTACGGPAHVVADYLVGFDVWIHVGLLEQR